MLRRGESIVGLVLELRVPEFVPELLCYASSIVDQAVTCDIVADVLDIACQQGEGVGVETWVDSLWEVDDFRLTLPVQDVVG